MISLTTNISDLILQRTLLDGTLGLNEAVVRMTTGLKVNHAKDNAAGYSIIEDLNSKISSMLQIQSNTEDGISMLSTAEGILSEITDKYKRLRELSVQMANGTYDKKSIEAIQSEADAILLEIDRLKNSASVNGLQLFGKMKVSDTQNVSVFSRLARSVNLTTDDAEDYTSLTFTPESSVSQLNAGDGSSTTFPASYSLRRTTAYSVSPTSDIIIGGTSGSIEIAYGDTVTVDIDGVLYEVSNTITTGAKTITWSKDGSGQISFNCSNLIIRAQADVEHNLLITGTRNRIYGGDEADILTNATGTYNYYYGEAGDDTIIVGEGTFSQIYGGDGGDNITAGQYVGIIESGTGDDTINISGAQNAITVSAGAGNDIFNISTFDNIIYKGDDGDDTFNLLAGSKKGVIDGGTGTNVATGSAMANFTIANTTNSNASLIEVAANSTINHSINGINYTFTNNKSETLGVIYNVDSDDIISFSLAKVSSNFNALIIKGDENAVHKINLKSGGLVFEGGKYDDQICISANKVAVYGNSGNDTITIKGYYAYIHGGDGDDVITSTGSYDRHVIYGDAGNDTISVSSTSTVVGGLGNDIITTSAGGYGNSIYDEAGENILNDNAEGSLIKGFGDLDNAESIELLANETKSVNIDNKNYSIKNNFISENVVLYSLNPITKEITFSGNYLTIDAQVDVAHNVIVQGYNVTFNGGGGDDTLKAKGVQLSLYGKDGDDNLDVLKGTQCSLYGGGGNDILSTTGGSATSVNGGNGDDTLNISKVDSAGSSINGGAGNDTFYVNTKTTVIDASGDNYYEINADNVLISGGDGNDTFVVNSANNSISGGAGNDYFVVNSTDSNTLDGGIGEDYGVDNSGGNASFSNIISDPNSGMLQFTAVDEVKTLTIDGKIYTITNTTTRDSAIESHNLKYSYNLNTKQITFDGSNFTISGDSVGSNIILKGSNNVFNGSNNIDIVMIESGSNNAINTLGANDIITMNSIENTINSGAGNDKITLNATTSLLVDAGSGNDDLILNSNGNTSISLGSGDDKVSGVSSSNTIDLTSGSNNLLLTGDSNNVSADDGDNNILIDGMSNVIIAGDGTNRLGVRGSDNELTAGDGVNNISIYGDENNLITNSGMDSVIIDGSFNVMSSLGGVKNVSINGNNNNVATSDANDKITVEGRLNILNVGSGNDEVSVVGSNNTISADAGNNTIKLKGDSNFYQGGVGIDNVEVKGNSNSVSGGLANDVFTVNGIDNIIDGEDGANNILMDYGSNTVYSNVKRMDYEPFQLNVKVGIGDRDDAYISTTLGFNPALLDLDFSSKEGALNNIAQLDSFLVELETQMVNIGSQINRLQYTLDEQNIRLQNMISHRSTMRDADIAEESSKYIKYQILQEASSTLLATSRNLRKENVLALLYGLNR